MQRHHLACIAVAILAVAPAPARAHMQGDAEAIALADDMVEALGGKEAWASARWMYAEERSFSSGYALGLDYTGWRGLSEPYGRNRVESEEITYEQAWTPGGGWRVRNGEYVQFDAERLAEEVSFWPREIYTLYHRFAAEDPALRLISTDERAFRVEDAESGAPMGTFTISLEGGPLVWSSGDTDQDVTYVYGPLRSFGAIKLPAWGAQTNGSWRFNYTAAELHYDAPRTDLTEPPEDHRP